MNSELQHTITRPRLWRGILGVVFVQLCLSRTQSSHKPSPEIPRQTLKRGARSTLHCTPRQGPAIYDLIRDREIAQKPSIHPTHCIVLMSSQTLGLRVGKRSRDAAPTGEVSDTGELVRGRGLAGPAVPVVAAGR